VPIVVGRDREYIFVLGEQHRGVVDKDVDRTDVLDHRALSCSDLSTLVTSI
jgi:hypothetical protein